MPAANQSSYTQTVPTATGSAVQAYATPTSRLSLAVSAAQLPREPTPGRSNGGRRAHFTQRSDHNNDNDIDADDESNFPPCWAPAPTGVRKKKARRDPRVGATLPKVRAVEVNVRMKFS